MPKAKGSKSISSAQSFVQKLLTILQDEQCQQFIHWTDEEDSFVITDVTKFTQHVLHKYFKKIHYSSFIRQLNMYGFNKIRHQEGENVYKNQHFLRNDQEQLKNIKRKINPSNQKQDRVVLYHPNDSLGKQLKDLKNRQNNLQGMCQQLITQNQKILQQNNKIVKELTNRNKEKNSKMEQILLSLILTKGGGQLALNSPQTQKMLSITNQQSQPPNYPVNLQNLQQMLEDNDKMRQVMKMFPKQEKKRKRNKNYTIVNENSPSVKSENKEDEKSISEHKEEDNLLSISDFFNMQSPIGKAQDDHIN